MPDSFTLLTACCLPAGSPGAAARIRQATTQDTNWPEVLKRATGHGLLPLVCRRVLDSAADLLGGDAGAAVSVAAFTSAARALGATQQLATVVGALQREGIAVLPYKGPALALDAYGAATLRESDDLDVVVAPADLARARDVMAAGGFHTVDGLTWRESLEANEWQGHVALARTDDLLPVELHWRFCDRKLPWTLPVADVLRRATQRPIAGVSMPVPERGDQLLLVLLHAARHGWDRLEAIACAGALLAVAGGSAGAGGPRAAATPAGSDGSAGAFDPDAFVARARAVGGLRAALVGLEVTRRLLGTQLPEALTVAVRNDPQVAGLADIAVARLRAGDAGDVRDARLHLASLERMADRLRYVALGALLPTPRDRQAVTLPWMLAPLYVPLRLARLARALITR